MERRDGKPLELLLLDCVLDFGLEVQVRTMHVTIFKCFHFINPDSTTFNSISERSHGQQRKLKSTGYLSFRGSNLSETKIFHSFLWRLRVFL
jgi:hypothetical protein